MEFDINIIGQRLLEVGLGMKVFLRKLIYITRQFGLDPIHFMNSLRMFPKYFADVKIFKSRGGYVNSFLPALHDRNDSGGTAKGHYFWQDLICAQWVAQENPNQHFDVGSRLDGFIAHLASVRQVYQLDIRPNRVSIPNVQFLLGDAQQNLTNFKNKFDSVSSLHSIEHFGLGRYGDEIQSDGHVRGMINISECVKVKGYLYISFPIGKERVEFNSQRVLDAEFPIKILHNFELIEFVLIPWTEPPIFGTSPYDFDSTHFGFAGLYKFKRLN